MAPRNAVGRTAARGITAGSGSSMSRALEIFRNAWSGTTKIAACGAPALFALTACHRPAHQRGLPARSPVTAHLFVVGGGRAGAAAFDNGDIYFDVLATSYRVALGTIESYPSTDGIVGFYAHEMHHLALGQIIDSLTGGLTLVG